MKKRVLAMAVCAALLLSLCGCGTKQETETTTEASKTETTTEASKTETTTESTASDAPDTPDNTLPEEADAGTVIDCGNDLAKAAELVHFEMRIPELSNYTVSVIGGETISVDIPINTDNDIYVRMRMNCESIEKVTGTLWEIDPVTEDWNGIEVTALKEGDTYYSLGFGAEIGYYGVTCTNGMDKDSLYGYLENLYNANKPGELSIPD